MVTSYAASVNIQIFQTFKWDNKTECLESQVLLNPKSSSSLVTNNLPVDFSRQNPSAMTSRPPRKTQNNREQKLMLDTVGKDAFELILEMKARSLQVSRYKRKRVNKNYPVEGILI